MEPVVELRDVTCRYHRADLPAVAHVSLSIYPGELVALLGPSGCGKSTTLRLIAGLEQPDAGEIWLNGTLVASASVATPPEARRLGMVFQDYALFPHLTVAENVGFALHRMPSRERQAHVGEALELVNLAAFASRYPHQLSGGQQQRVALARALAPRPPVVLLDEPFSNLDAALRSQMRDDLRDILSRAGATAVFVTHDQAEALALGDRIALLNNGQIEQIGAPDTLFQSPRTRFVAQFMGQADFVPATVTSTGLETELGMLTQQVALPVGSTVEVLVRYDDVTLSPAANTNARVVGRTYEGETYGYTVQLLSGLRLRCKTSHTQRYAVGDRVQVALLDDHPLSCFVESRAV